MTQERMINTILLAAAMALGALPASAQGLSRRSRAIWSPGQRQRAAQRQRQRRAPAIDLLQALA